MESGGDKRATIYRLQLTQAPFVRNATSSYRTSIEYAKTAHDQNQNLRRALRYVASRRFVSRRCGLHSAFNGEHVAVTALRSLQTYAGPYIDFKSEQCGSNDSQAQASRVVEHPARFNFTINRPALYDDFSCLRRFRLSSSAVSNIYITE